MVTEDEPVDASLVIRVADARINELSGRVAELESELRVARERIAELEAMIARLSTVVREADEWGLYADQDIPAALASLIKGWEAAVTGQIEAVEVGPVELFERLEAQVAVLAQARTALIDHAQSSEYKYRTGPGVAASYAFACGDCLVAVAAIDRLTGET